MEAMPRWLNLANLFTLARIALVPFILRDILEGRNVAALQLFFAASITDVIDGFLARNLGQTTPFGAYLDPIADKFLLSGLYLAFGAEKYVMWAEISMD